MSSVGIMIALVQLVLGRGVPSPYVPELYEYRPASRVFKLHRPWY